MSNLAIFDFDEQVVRAVLVDGEPWFVGKDVCRCLEIANHNDALGRLGDDEKKGVGITDPHGRNQQRMTCINEPGTYRLVFTSRTDAAERFKRWVTHDVLPALRKEGRYEMAGSGDGQHLPDETVITDLEFDELRKAAPVLREWRMLYGKAAARRLAFRLPVPQVTTLIDQEISSSGDDDVQAFSADHLVSSPDAVTPASEIFAAYLDWCENNETRPATQTTLGRRLAGLGWLKERRSGRVVYVGATVAVNPMPPKEISH